MDSLSNDSRRYAVQPDDWDDSDPRVQASCQHTVFDILSIAILAVTCGADDWTDLETLGKKRREWLATFLELCGGIPSHDTFRRVLGLLDRKQFTGCSRE